MISKISDEDLLENLSETNSIDILLSQKPLIFQPSKIFMKNFHKNSTLLHQFLNGLLNFLVLKMAEDQEEM